MTPPTMLLWVIGAALAALAGAALVRHGRSTELGQETLLAALGLGLGRLLVLFGWSIGGVAVASAFLAVALFRLADRILARRTARAMTHAAKERSMADHRAGRCGLGCPHEARQRYDA